MKKPSEERMNLISGVVISIVELFDSEGLSTEEALIVTEALRETIAELMETEDFENES